MIIIVDQYCKGCNICIRFCPKNILELSGEVNSRGYSTPRVVNGSECNKCRQCELFCPDFAIYVIEDEESANG